MINKIVAIQGDDPSKLNPISDTTIFLANEIQNTDFSFLSNIQKEKIDEEKTKMYQEIIIKCK